ncbi:MAG: TetR/AcrR family transcriptional regulator [Bacteroidota bacterium]
MGEDLKKQWILAGYEVFALQGPHALKVEVLSRMVGKNKSSFYHHFADLEVFTEFLLHYHLERAEVIAAEEKRCNNVDPELLEVLVNNKIDLLFNRQLRFHRRVPAFEKCFKKTSEYAAEAVLGIWAEAIGLTENTKLAFAVLMLSLENFYLQITEETLHYKWLSAYVKNLRNMVDEFKRIGEQATTKL